MENKEEKGNSLSLVKSIIIILLVIVLIGLCAYIVFNEDHKKTVKESIEKDQSTTTTIIADNTNTFNEKKMNDGTDSIKLKLNGKTVNLSYQLAVDDKIASESGYEYDYETVLSINENSDISNVKFVNVKYAVFIGEDKKEYLVLMYYPDRGYDTLQEQEVFLIINDVGKIIDKINLPITKGESNSAFIFMLKNDEPKAYEIREDGIYYASSFVNDVDGILENKAEVNIAHVSVNNSKVNVSVTDETCVGILGGQE